MTLENENPLARLNQQWERILRQIEDCRESQKAERRRLKKEYDAAVARLDEELVPLQKKIDADQNLRRLVLAPWETSSQSWDAHRRVLANSNPTWNSRAWLRIASYEGVRWEVDFWETKQPRNLVLGPPTSRLMSDREADFVRHQKTVDDILRAEGFILLESMEDVDKLLDIFLDEEDE